MTLPPGIVIIKSRTISTRETALLFICGIVLVWLGQNL